MLAAMSYLPILLFGLMCCAAWLAWGLPWVAAPALALVYLLASLACLLAYYLDKAAARAGRRRISERSLLLLGLAGGWPGALLAQQWFRHKSSKQAFRRKFWCTVLFNGGLFILFLYLASPAGPLHQR